MTGAAFDVFTCPLDGMRLIEASAGTGKTWTLSALYLRLLLERRLDVQHILVVTFTNAATAELRERIRSRIAELLSRLRGSGPAGADPFLDALLHGLRTRHGLADAEIVRRLEPALHGFDEAAIFTIHGFCQRALADAPFAAAMPMAQQLLADDRELRLQVVQDFWRRHIAGDAVSPALAAHLLERGDSPQSLLALLGQHLARPLSRLLWPEALDRPIDLADAAEIAAAHAAAVCTWRRDRQSILDHVAEALPRLNANLYHASTLQQAADEWDALAALDERPVSLAGFERLDLLGRTRLQPKKGQAPPAPHPFFSMADTLLVLHARRDQALALQRLQLQRRLLAEGPPALRRAKREQRVLGFDDMLHDLHLRLQGAAGAALASALRNRFAAALIDEFQDTDPLQYAIFRAIYGGGTAPWFLVGDPKQAIYSFRNADLQVYLRARHEANAIGTLAENQRSTPGLLRALNALFGANPRAFMLPGLHYPPVACGDKPRKPLLDRSAAPRAALQLWQLPRQSDGELPARRVAVQAALDACAGEIARLLGASRRGEITLDGRALAAHDIAVLVRSHAQGSAMRRALARVGVGSVELSQASVFHSTDAADLERLLAAILEPARVPLLRAALATEAMGFDAASLQAAASDDALLLGCVERFSAYRDTWVQHGIGRMLRQWLRGEDVSRRLLARGDGERRLTNLLHLAECLHEAAAEHAAPEALLRWLQRQRDEARPGDAAQLRLESDRDLVPVVTIHKAKGLEYGIVFCPMLWDGLPSPLRRTAGLEYHDATGEPVIDLRPLPKGDLAAIKERLALERDAETMRLIYVALTRAVHRCYLVVGSYRRQHGRHWSSRESSHARLHWLVCGQGLEPQAWKQHEFAPAAIDAAWAALATTGAPDIGWQPLPGPPQPALASAAAQAEALAALAPPASIPPGWWVGSYSSLAHGTRHDAAAADHDLRAAAAGTADEDATALDADDVLRFPRGAVAGECMHAVFERIDFTQPATWPAAVGAALQRFAQVLPATDDAAARPRMLLRMLHDVLHTPLAGGLRLAEVPPRQTLAEMEFHLPSHRLEAQRLHTLLRRHGLELPPLAFGTLSGYLRGFIDLVFEHEGRFHLVDWKSNVLGTTPAAYGTQALARTMAEQGYHLQALLYALALHRHLQQRLPHYRHELHFGGVWYLFVRGVRPGWVQADGSAAGVFVHRPSLLLLHQLSAVLDGDGAPT